MTQRESDFKIGQRLSALRRLQGLSQRCVAEKAELAPSYLSRIETGKVQPTFPTLLRILRSVGCDRRDLLEPERLTVSKRGSCPVTANGHCLLDSIRSAVEPGQEGDCYTPRRIRLLRKFGAWARNVSTDRIGAMEILLDDWVQTSSLPPVSAPKDGPSSEYAASRVDANGAPCKLVATHRPLTRGRPQAG